MASWPAAAQEASPKDALALICPISGMVDDGMAVVVERAVKESADAAVLVFEVDTPGGRVDSAIEISKSIMDSPVPTLAFVTGMGAISAGALISYSCDEIVMTPGTNIGASAPIVMGAGEPSEEFNEKTRSYLRSRYRTLGEEKGHNPFLAEAMVDAKIELRGRLGDDGTYVVYRVEDRGQEAEQAEDATEVLEDVRKVLEREAVEAVREIFETDPAKAARRLLGGEEAEPAEALPAEAQEPDRMVLEDGSELICAKGELLTLTSSEALRYGLIPVKADTIGEALASLDFPGLREVRIVPRWDEDLYRWLTSPMIAGLLLMIGIGGLYLEIRTPGVGLPGIIGATCLAIFFGSHLVLGLADWIDILFVVLGVALLLAEVFLIPGFGVTGVAGILCILAGLYLSLTRVTVPQYTWDFDRLVDAGQTLTTATVSFGVLSLLTWKLFPKTPFARWLVLAEAQDVDLGYVVQTEEQERAALGLKGVSTSMLRPAGRGRFGGETYDIMTRGEFIEKGRPIEIIQVEGNRYVVAEIKED